MKKILTLAALFAGLSISAYAQDSTRVQQKKEVRQEVKHRKHHRADRLQKKTPEEIAQLKTDRLDKELKFTEAQKKEVYAYHLDQAKKWKVKHEEMQVERDARRKEMKAEREEFQKLLTPEQQEIMKNKMVENRKDRFNRDGQRNFKDRQMKRKGMDRKMPVEKEVEEKTVENSNS